MAQARIATSADVGFFSALQGGQALQYNAATNLWENKSALNAASTSAAGSFTISSPGTHLFCNATSGAITVTLPAASVANGATARVTKTDTSTNVVKVIAPASAKMNGVTVGGTLTTPATKTAAYTAGVLEHVKGDATGGLFTITLPAATAGTAGSRWVRVTKTDASANTILVQPASGTIDGDVAFSANRQFVGQNFYSDGTNWHYMPETEAVSYWQNTTQDFISDGTTWWMV